MSMGSKVMSMADAIARFVHDRDTVYVGGFVQQVPFAAIHELIRQQKKNLTVSMGPGIGPTDLLIGAGCVSKVITAYTWNPIPKPAHNFKRAMEQGIPCHIDIEEYSLLSLTLGYFAGALDLPFVTTKTLLGSDLLSFLPENRFRMIESPFTAEQVCAIAPIKHDVGIVQLQRADKDGNGQGWGMLGDCKYGINSCSQVVLCVEEIVSREEIRSDPNRTIIPGFKVNAVVEVPWGAHPSPMIGYYDIDWAYYGFYAETTKSLEGFRAYLREWIYETDYHKAYLEMIGNERLQELKAKVCQSKPVNYGRYKSWSELR